MHVTIEKNITTSSAKTSVRKKTTTAEKIPTPRLRHEVQSPLVPLVAGEVIEISSDEDERPFTRSVKEKVLRVNHTPELRRRVKELETVRNASINNWPSLSYSVSCRILQELCKRTYVF